MSIEVTVSVTLPIDDAKALLSFLAGMNAPVIIDPPIPEGDDPVDDIPDVPPPQIMYETKVIYGVNFRSIPNTSSESYVYRMIPKGEDIHVIEQIDDGWLKIIVQDGTVGYISALPKYTTYSQSSDQDKTADKLISYGESFMGAPYKFGAKMDELVDGVRVFDCSSFVKTVFRDVLGISLPRVSKDQATVGTDVNKENLQKGDLVFFTSRNLPVGHVAIYAGNDRLLHTYSIASGGVRYTGFKGTQWEDRFTSARRHI